MSSHASFLITVSTIRPSVTAIGPAGIPPDDFALQGEGEIRFQVERIAGRSKFYFAEEYLVRGFALHLVQDSAGFDQLVSSTLSMTSMTLPSIDLSMLCRINVGLGCGGKATHSIPGPNSTWISW